MRISELAKAYAMAVKAAEAFDTPRHERRIFHQIAQHIFESCSGTDRGSIPRQQELAAAADRAIGRVEKDRPSCMECGGPMNEHAPDCSNATAPRVR